MANAQRVRLFVTSEDPGNGNWKYAQSTSDQEFWYRFKGGNRGRGDQEVEADGQADAFVVLLRDSPGFKMIGFWKNQSQDTHDQLSGVVSRSGGTAIVEDACTADTGEMEYGIVVQWVASDESIFICHPVIRNDPPSM